MRSLRRKNKDEAKVKKRGKDKGQEVAEGPGAGQTAEEQVTPEIVDVRSSVNENDLAIAEAGTPEAAAATEAGTATAETPASQEDQEEESQPQAEAAPTSSDLEHLTTSQSSAPSPVQSPAQNPSVPRTPYGGRLADASSNIADSW